MLQRSMRDHDALTSAKMDQIFATPTKQTRDIHEANSSLKTLSLDCNQVSDEGAIALAQALQVTLVVLS